MNFDSMNPKYVYRMEYMAWVNLISRLKRGDNVQVADEWIEDFDRFMTDMGKCNIRTSIAIQKIDYSKPYGPGNCIWNHASNVRSNNRAAVILNLSGSKESEYFGKLIVYFNGDINKVFHRLRSKNSVFELTF